jgi:hypothetical protein
MYVIIVIVIFMKTRSLGGEWFHANGMADGQAQSNSRLWQFYEST